MLFLDPNTYYKIELGIRAGLKESGEHECAATGCIKLIDGCLSSKFQNGWKRPYSVAQRISDILYKVQGKWGQKEGNCSTCGQIEEISPICDRRKFYHIAHTYDNNPDQTWMTSSLPSVVWRIKLLFIIKFHKMMRDNLIVSCISYLLLQRTMNSSSANKCRLCGIDCQHRQRLRQHLCEFHCTREGIQSSKEPKPKKQRNIECCNCARSHVINFVGFVGITWKAMMIRTIYQSKSKGEGTPN